VDRLTAQLEPHLSSEEAVALRGQLYQNLREALGYPPGTARAASDRQVRLLAESGALDDGLQPAHLEAEFDIVRRSETRPSTAPGYIDEVDLGNGHTWRRQSDGTWCRFSNPNPTRCGTTIPGAPKISPQAQAKAAEVQHQIAGERERLAELAEALEMYPDIARRLREGRIPNQRTLNVTVLTQEERDLFSDIVGRDLDEMTIGELEQFFTPPTRRYQDPRDLDPKQMADRPFIDRPTGEPSEARRLLQQSETLLQRLNEQLYNLTRSLYDRVRGATPSAAARVTTLSRARRAGQAKGLSPIDEVSGAPPRSGRLSVDHIVPVRDIVDMPGFSLLAQLDWDEARRIANWDRNMVAIDKEINEHHRKNISWADPFPLRSTYSREALDDIIARETQLRIDIQAEIDRQLALRGRVR
jgi:hypothetical protein